MSKTVSIPDVGIIIGRFQVNELHQAHRTLIESVCARHDKVIILLGLSPLRTTRENPLDFESRKQMLLAEFPRVNVLYVKDIHSDELWSKRVDEIVRDVLTPAQTAVIYGGRDSFMAHYSGKFPVEELEQHVFVSGSEIRKGISSRSVKATPDFRAGVVWASQAHYPAVLPTVDIAIFNEDRTKLLLGRKAAEDKFRFIGGFADPTDNSLEHTARREVSEEAGIEIGDLTYVTSMKMDDWRYRRETDKIITTFFTAKHLFGGVRPGDDIAEVRWYEVSKLTPDTVMDVHRPLMEKLLETLGQDSAQPERVRLADREPDHIV